MIWRLRLAWAVRIWPWRVPSHAKRIGIKRPPEHVFEAFRRLHSIDAGPKEDADG